MNKKFISGLLVIASTLCLSGCCLSHEWQDATCTEPRTCIKCNETEGEPIGHSWSEATCTVSKTCSVCGETEGEALGHAWLEATCTVPKTCSVCGETEGEALGHAWSEATCTVPKTCSVCGETEGEALGHAWSEATCTVPKTCSVCGEIEGEALGHVWIDANYQDPKTCSVCGETEGTPLTAAFEEHGLVINAKVGVTYDYVTVCGKDMTKETIGHITFSDYQIHETLEGFDTPEGYEWRTVHVTILFDDENANYYGASSRSLHTDYYDIEGYEDSWHEEEGNFHYMGEELSSNGFRTVNVHGKDYSKCDHFYTSEWSEWVNSTCFLEIDCGFCVPVGYDGATLMFCNYANGENGTYAYEQADENTLFFRMD